MSADQMDFPKDWHRFLDDYSFKDAIEYYTNGAYLIPKFRAEQALEYYADGLIDRVLEIVDDADRKAGDKTYIVLEDGRFYSQANYIKKIMEDIIREGEQK